jgi:hypothetical protein
MRNSSCGMRPKLAGAEAIPHRDKLSTGALLARFLGLACFDDRSVEPEFPTSRLPSLMSRRCLSCLAVLVRARLSRLIWARFVLLHSAQCEVRIHGWDTLATRCVVNGLTE